MVTAYYRSPFGWLRVDADTTRIISIAFVSQKGIAGAKPPAVLNRCLRQLDEYFKGTRKNFSTPLKVAGTLFQLKVIKALQKIPYGRTSSYAGLARRIGRPRAARAVGAAVGKNRVCLLVPCHRVIGSDGSLTGYAYGITRKKALLWHEKMTLAKGL